MRHILGGEARGLGASEDVFGYGMARSAGGPRRKELADPTVREAGRVRVRLREELDLASAPMVRERLRRLRERGAAVLLDLDELQFMDMSGLRMGGGGR